MRVSVFCSSAPDIPTTSLDLAFNIGKAIGEQGWDLVWGGGRSSMMGQVAKGARSVGAKTIGVIPEPLINLEFEDKDATHMHVVKNMRDRKAKIEDLADAFIALPGGYKKMNKLSHLELNIKIKKPIDKVWASLVDWHSQSDWMLQTKVWSELDQDRTVKNGKGVLIFAFTGLFPSLYPKIRIGILDTMEITRFKPPVLCEVVHIGRVIRGTGKFELKKSKDGTIFNWQEDLVAHPVFLLVMKPLLLLGVWISLRRFARQLTR